MELLEEGQVVGVAVGGAEEALFDWDYSPDWRKRNGFAQLALLTGWYSGLLQAGISGLDRNYNFLGHVFLIQKISTHPYNAWPGLDTAKC